MQMKIIIDNGREKPYDDVKRLAEANDCGFIRKGSGDMTEKKWRIREREMFRGMTFEQKVRCLVRYMMEQDLQKTTWNSVALYAFGNALAVRAVKSVLEHYGIDSYSRGLFASEGLFERRFGVVVTEHAVRRFVKTYPKGSAGVHHGFIQFVLDRTCEAEHVGTSGIFTAGYLPHMREMNRWTNGRHDL